MKIIGLYFLFGFLFPQLCHARIGSETGNGGAAIVCRDDKEKLISSELLDFYEGSVLYGRVHPNAKPAAADQARNLIPLIDEILGTTGHDSQLKALDSVIAQLRVLPEGVGLSPTEDWGNFVVPKNCSIIQAVNFRDDGDIFADAEIWNSYSETRKAGAFIHELIYNYARQNGDESNSFRVRNLVSLLFSNMPPRPVLPLGFDSTSFGFCKAQSSEFYIVRETQTSSRIYFSKILGRTALAETVSRELIESPNPVIATSQSFESELDSAINRGLKVHINMQNLKGSLVIGFGGEKIEEPFECREFVTPNQP